MDNDICEHPSGGFITSDGNCRIARVDRHSGVNIPAVLSHIAHYANMVGVVGNIKKGIQYIVQVPTHLQAALGSGKYTMLHGEESGKTWATIVERLPNGKNKIIANCPIKEEAFYQGNPMQDMSSSFANFLLQQQMAALAQMLGEMYDVILRVESGQNADRVGQLIAGRDGIVHALKMKDAESRKFAIVVARGSLHEAQGKIGEVLKQKIESFKVIPKYAFQRLFKECTHNGYLDKCDDEYNGIQDYFDLYMLATKLIAESLIICGEEESANSVLKACEQFIKGLDFSKMQTILYSHPKKTVEELFFHTATPRIAADKVFCLESTKLYDYLEITVDGKEVLEGLEYGQ